MILNDWGKVLLPFTGWGTRKWNLRILIQAVTNDFLRRGVILGDGVPSHVSVTMSVEGKDTVRRHTQNSNLGRPQDGTLPWSCLPQWIWKEHLHLTNHLRLAPNEHHIGDSHFSRLVKTLHATYKPHAYQAQPRPSQTVTAKARILLLLRSISTAPRLPGTPSRCCMNNTCYIS